MDVLRFLATQDEPALLTDIASACKVDVREVRADLRFLRSEHLVRVTKHRGVLTGLGRDHMSPYLAVTITDQGLAALTAGKL